MAEQASITQGSPLAEQRTRQRRQLPYERWLEAQNVPVYRGNYVEDMKTLDLAPWPVRECNAGFLYFTGQEGISEARIEEIPPGKTLPPMKMTLDEVAYIVDGRGLTSVWTDDSPEKKTFEWQKFSMFLLPRGAYRQFSNTQGNRPARILYRNFLPLGMSLVPDPSFFFNNPAITATAFTSDEKEFYSQTKMVQGDPFSGRPLAATWTGNFFPDMLAWDKMVPLKDRGAGGSIVQVHFTGSGFGSTLSEFPVGTYKKAHRHGPGRVILIVTGVGFSVMWEEGKDRVVVPWHEGSVFSPPNRWFHQFFNTGPQPARYLRPISASALPQFGGHSERVEDAQRDQIEYPDEDPWVRRTFEQELAKNGVKSLMPEEAYRDPNYQWAYADDN